MISLNAFKGRVEFAPNFAPRPAISHIIFDFDGTLSLVRAGWTDVMVDMCAELIPHQAGEDLESLRQTLRDEILQLNGKPTIFQMMHFAERVKARRGEAWEPVEYKDEYARRLEAVIRARKDTIRAGGNPAQFAVRGVLDFLPQLEQSGFTLILVSGTEERFVREEGDLLGVNKYFGPRFYAAGSDDKAFSKRAAMEEILRDCRIPASQLLTFGDGVVETECTKALGGLAVAVASDEQSPGSGKMDEWKRAKLLQVGASIVIPDYHDASVLMNCLLGKAS